MINISISADAGTKFISTSNNKKSPTLFSRSAGEGGLRTKVRRTDEGNKETKQPLKLSTLIAPSGHFSRQREKKTPQPNLRATRKQNSPPNSPPSLPLRGISPASGRKKTSTQHELKSKFAA